MLYTSFLVPSFFWSHNWYFHWLEFGTLSFSIFCPKIMKLQQFWAGYFSGSQKYITLKPKYFLPGCGPLFKLSFFYFSLASLKLWIRKLEYQKTNFPCFLSHWFHTRPIGILERTYLIYNHSKCTVQRTRQTYRAPRRIECAVSR